MAIVGHYPFDGNANDAVGGNHGVPQGAPAYAPGIIGQALDLVTASDYVRISSVPFSGAQNRTFAAWVYYRDDLQGAEESIFSALEPDAGTGANGERWTLRRDSGYLRVEIAGSGYTSGLALPLGEWLHVAAKLDGTTLGDHRLFVNGHSEAVAGPSTVDTHASAIGLFGLKSEQAVKTLDGLIDDARLYDEARASNDIRHLHLAGRGLLTTANPGVVQYRRKAGRNGFFLLPGNGRVGDRAIPDVGGNAIGHGDARGGLTLTAGSAQGTLRGPELVFDGSNDRVWLSPLGDFGSQLPSVVILFAFTNGSADGGLFTAADSTGSRGISFQFDGSGKPKLIYADGTGVGEVTAATATASDAIGVLKASPNGSWLIVNGQQIPLATDTVPAGYAVPDLDTHALVGTSNEAGSNSAYWGGNLRALAAFSGAEAEAYTFGDGMNAWMGLQGVGRNAGILGAATLGV